MATAFKPVRVFKRLGIDSSALAGSARALQPRRRRGSAQRIGGAVAQLLFPHDFDIVDSCRTAQIGSHPDLALAQDVWNSKRSAGISQRRRCYFSATSAKRREFPPPRTDRSLLSPAKNSKAAG